MSDYLAHVEEEKTFAVRSLWTYFWQLSFHITICCYCLRHWPCYNSTNKNCVAGIQKRPRFFPSIIIIIIIINIIIYFMFGSWHSCATTSVIQSMDLFY